MNGSREAIPEKGGGIPIKIPEEIIDAAKGAMFRFGMHPPTVFVLGTKQKGWFTLTMPETYPERVTKMMKSGISVARLGQVGELKQVIYVCEGWASPPRKSFVRPSADPDRSEVLLINAIDVETNTQSLVMFTCVRDAYDKVLELKPMPGEKPVEVSSELLPSFVAGFRAFKRIVEK